MLTPYFAYRVLDPVSGAVVIPALPHRHASKWTFRAITPGATGAASLGEFEIPLFSPLQDGYKQAADSYSKLDYNQRVEAFLVTSGVDSPVGGTPYASGVIRGLPRSTSDFSIRGNDSLQLLTQARTKRTEFFTGTTDVLAAFALRAEQLVYGDDLRSGVGAYTQSGAAGWTATTDEGLPVATVAGGTPGTTWLTTASFGSANFGECVIDGYFRVQAGLTVGDTTRFGMAAGGAGGLQTFGGVNIRCTNHAGTTATTWEVDLEIASGSLGGPLTNQARVTLALALPSNQFRCQIQLIGRAGSYSAATGVFTPNPAGTDFVWRVTVNGVDGNCVWIQIGASPSGPVGFYYDTSAAPGGAPQLWATQLVFRNRAAIFKQGIWNAGSRTVQQYYSRTPNFDILGVAAVTEGFVYRKSAGLGLNADVIDFGPAIGAQLAGQTGIGQDSIARFEAGRNLKDVSLEPSSENVASDVSLQLSPGSTQSGQVEWHNVAAMKKFGVITDGVSAQNVADFLAARALAQSIANLKGAPGLSKKMTVICDSTVGIPGPQGLWRELDFVRVQAPVEGLNDQRVQVLEYAVAEGSTEVSVIGDSWPLASPINQLARMWQTLDAIASGTMNITPSSSTGLVYDSRFATPTVVTAYGNDSLDSANNFRLRFNIPKNTSLIQLVTLSFSLLNYRTYSSFNITGTGTEAGHTHGGESGHSHSHSHSIPVNLYAAGASGALTADFLGPIGGAASAGTIPASGMNANAAGSSGHTHGAGSAHNHTVSGSSVIGIEESTVAQGVHVQIDGVDVTAQLIPSGPYGSGAAAPQDFSDIPITAFVTGGGWHEVQLTSTTQGRVQVQVTAFLMVKPF